MNRYDVWRAANTWGLLISGTALYAFGLQYFILPNQLMEGGVTGIAVLLNYALDLPVSITSLAINLPLFVLGWRLLGKEAMVYTFAGTVLLSLFLWVAESLVERGWLVPFRAEQDFMLAVLYAGVTLGTGLGLVFRAGGTTGGADIIARIVHRTRSWSMGRIILSLDAAILGISLLLIPKEKVLYTIVSVFIASRIIDYIQEGAYAAKAFTIMCRDPERLARRVTDVLDRGVTLMPAVGAFSGENRTVVFCVVGRFEIGKLKSLVRQHDRRAFIVISDVHDVLGEGFRDE
ncbi:YitT family protein [Cohnella hongkongensis]|uniref:YitT family protein n=1 Tax=Cohnella hongkongensis TaxID=178337 RepID=A0ABV9FFS4_9BACL